jgi:hypothetical protein
MTVLRDGDYMKHLVGYVNNNLSKGYNIDQIRILLLNQGYSRPAIDRAVRMAEANRPLPMPAVKEEPKIQPIVEEPPKKKGFFAWLFGSKKKEEDEFVKLNY